MAWTAPITASLNGTFTAAQFNATVRDNLAQTFPGKATSDDGRWFVSTGANTFAERRIQEVYTPDLHTTDDSTYFVDNLAPNISASTGTFAIVTVRAAMYNELASQRSYMSFSVSGATTLAASDDRAIITDVPGAGSGNVTHVGSSFGVTLTSGTNSFKAEYKSTGTAGHTAGFSLRRLTVWSF